MKGTRSNIMTAIAVLILVAALPSAIRDTIETGRLYLFSRQFIEELPQRITGPGRFRFILQPSIAILIGVRGSLADARAGPVQPRGAILAARVRQVDTGNGSKMQMRRSGVYLTGTLPVYRFKAIRRQAGGGHDGRFR